MKRYIALFAATLIAVMANATEPHTVYCSLSGASYSQIDYGQKSLIRNTLVDENGKAIYFNGIIGAMNYMSERGWVFVCEQKNYSQGVVDKREINVSTSLIFSTQITAPEQITEGIITRQMYREQSEE